ncbi:hypothetical protein [Arvimicrobium flavum]|uniref:hypothetical protein n=1 Tax=Arvimicrobium flavum TaxID=3393320 RepID=UPI00237B1E3C|nr:hypothetical protein [Mesorhizobium shangrilense]
MRPIESNTSRHGTPAISPGGLLNSRKRPLRGYAPSDRSDVSETFRVPDYIRLANIRSVVEVVPDATDEPSEQLLWHAYHTSWTGVVALALNGVATTAVDRVMDRIVPYFPLTIPGVVYIDARNDALLAWVLAKSDLVIGKTKWFYRRADRCPGRLIPSSLWLSASPQFTDAAELPVSPSRQSLDSVARPRAWADLLCAPANLDGGAGWVAGAGLVESAPHIATAENP